MTNSDIPAQPSAGQIIPFNFDGAEVRTVAIGGEPWFVGKDVAERLGYTNPNKAMNDHCKGVTKRYPLQTAGGMQEIRILSEADVLRLIVSSKLPAAEKFERWVFEEVLPAIRKSGGYMLAAPDETPEELALRALTVLQVTVERQKAQLAIVAPKADALDRIATADGSLNLTEAAKALQIRPKDLINFLGRNSWIYKRAGSANWLGYQARVQSGDLEHKVSTVLRPDGSERIAEQVRITPKGLAKLAKLLPPPFAVVGGRAA